MNRLRGVSPIKMLLNLLHLSQTTNSTDQFGMMYGLRTHVCCSLITSEGDLNLDCCQLLSEFACILAFFLQVESDVVNALLLLVLLFGNLVFQALFLLFQSGEELLSQLDFLVLQVEELVEVEAESDILQLSVAQIAHPELLLRILAQVLLVGGAGSAHSEATLFAVEISIAHAKHGHH